MADRSAPVPADAELAGRCAALARSAARLCQTPTAGVVLTGPGGGRVVAGTGLADRPSGAERELCNQVLATGAPLLVPDVRLDPRFPGSPARLFAGFPLTAPADNLVGVLYVLDRRARSLDPPAFDALGDLAAAAGALLERPPGRASPFEHAPVGYAEFSAAGLISTVNARLCQLLGCRSEDLLGAPRARLLAADPGRLGRGELRYPLQGADGHAVPVTVTVTPLPDGGGFAAFFIDDTPANPSPGASAPPALTEAAARTQFLSALLDTIDVGILACARDGKIVVANRAVQAWRPAGATGWVAPADWPATYHLHHPDGTLFTAAELPLVRAMVEGSVQDCELVLAPPGQPSRQLLAAGQVVRGSDGRLLGAVVAVQDVTAAKAREAELLRSEDRFRLGFQASPVPTALLDAAGRLVEVNEAVSTWLGYPREDLIGQSMALAVPGPDLPQAHARLDRLLGGGAGPERGERDYLTASGTVVRGLHSAVRIDSRDGEPLLLVQIEDLTERRAAERELARMAVHDSLTGLPNRLLFGDRIEQALARCQRAGVPVAVLCCGLDSFALVNEGMGRRAGDEALVAVAERIVRAVRPEDTVARLGGDEFAVLAEGVDESEAATLARRIERYLTIPVPVQADETLLTASIGVAVHPPDDGDLPRVDALLRDAEAAMRRAKALGKNRHTVFDAALRAEASARGAMETLLRRCLAEGGVRAHYQPVVELATGTVIGVEALCRLQSERGELIAPGAFIAIAEESGLIVPLGLQMLAMACEQSMRWERSGLPALSVSVNVAAQQAGREDFARMVFQSLAEAGLPANRLVLELTESALLEATPQTLLGLRRLRDEGVGIAIDDFGTQYASLRYVQRFPATQLKIDLSFVAGLPNGKADRAIVETVADLARRLDLECVAEGIETAAQLAVLQPLGIFGQGYLLGRPVEPAGIEDQLRAAAALH